MKKIIFSLLLIIHFQYASGSALYPATSNIIPLDKLMLYSIVSETTSQDLTKRFPEYANQLHIPEVLLLLNFINSIDATIILKFSADWCAPCKRLVPIVHEAAQEYPHEVIIIEINIDDAPELREMFNIQVVPTLIYFKNGLEVDRTNSIPKTTLLNKIKMLLDQKSIVSP